METGKQEGREKVFIAYLNDDDKILNAYAIILEIKEFVKFQTNENIITIPLNRLLKIKERVQ